MEKKTSTKQKAGNGIKRNVSFSKGQKKHIILKINEWFDMPINPDHYDCLQRVKEIINAL